ncbi:MAG: ABC transporter ATP-binding protein [Actinomycetota bacterium]
MYAIRAVGVTKAYDERPVLDGFSVEIPVGETFCLLGPNGAGKTTMVEILEGYRTADGGTVEVLGVDPHRGDAHFRSRIGIVLQQTTSFENFTVSETVEMFADLFPDPLGVDEALDLVELGPQRSQLAVNLSGGQRRRLDVACGLVGRPELLFLDEPTTGLDPEARRGLWAVIRRLRRQGTTVLLTTHYLDEAEHLADRIGVLLNGRLETVAAPAELGSRHAATATVRFVPPDTGDFRAWDRDGTMVATTTPTPARLVSELEAEHGELVGLTVTRPSLEDIYLQMVERSGHGEVQS